MRGVFFVMVSGLGWRCICILIWLVGRGGREGGWHGSRVNVYLYMYVDVDLDGMDRDG